MKQYLDLCRKVLAGKRKTNRTGIDHIGYHGDMMKFNLVDGFPAVTTKQLFYKQTFAEMLGFLRGYSNAADFRELGCKVWDANANENEQWLNNPNRQGEDDLGSIYGVQARGFKKYQETSNSEADYKYDELEVDQLKNVYEDLRNGIDNRREIVTHWNPAEMDQMALPPCHMFYQFGLEPLTFEERLDYFKLSPIFQQTARDRAELVGIETVMKEMDMEEIPSNLLTLSMYQRSCDVPLGIPFNIAGYAWLLSVMAQITNTVAGEFTHMMHDIHYYDHKGDQVPEGFVETEKGLREQIERKPMDLPTLWINPEIKTLEDLETWVTVDDFRLDNYNHHPAIKFPFAV